MSTTQGRCPRAGAADSAGNGAFRASRPAMLPSCCHGPLLDSRDLRDHTPRAPFFALLRLSRTPIPCRFPAGTMRLITSGSNDSRAY